MTRQPEMVQDKEDLRLLDDIVITIDGENNKRGVNLKQDYKIGQVSQFLGRNLHNLGNYCIPKEFSIGPYRTSRYWLYKTHPLKLKLTAKFIESFIEGKSGESLLNEIRKNIEKLKNCFDTNVVKDFNDGYLARLLFLDGCALLQFMHSYLLDELEKKFGIDNHQASLIREDLFALDNQIPFRVLELLLNLTTNPNKLKDDIVNFLHLNNIMMVPIHNLSGHKQWNEILRMRNENTHLLDILHSLIILGDDDVDIDSNNSTGILVDNIKCHPRRCNPKNNGCCLPHFNCLRRKRRSINDYFKKISSRYYSKPFFRNVQELKSAGIEFKPNSGLGTVSFNTGCFNVRGYLKLPPIIVDEWTESKLMNLVAYEMCLGNNYKKDWYFVTSYIKLMDFLVDKEQDVKELRASRMLWNRLSSDADVTTLFNNIGSRCLEPPLDVYSNIKIQIQTHCDGKCATWMTQVYQKHFSSPFTALALLATVIILSLTATQTWYAVNPKN